MSRFLARISAADQAVGEIYIYEEIGWWGVTAGAFARKLDELRAKGVKTLNVYVNSPGGDVFDGIAIYNLLRRFGDTVVHIDGLAASAASIIALAGKKVICAPNGMVMIHEPWTIALGAANDLRAIADQLDQVRDALVATYVDETGQSKKNILDWVAAETWMTAEEAKERGFVDEISSTNAEDVADRALTGPSSSQLLEKFSKTPSALLARLALPTPAARPPEDDAAGVLEPSMKAIAKYLNLADTVSEVDIINALVARDTKATEAAAPVAQVLSLTGKATAAEAMGVLHGWKAGSERAVELDTRISKIEGEALDAKVARLVDDGVKAGQIAPAQKDFWLATGKKDAATLEAFLATAPKIAAVTTEHRAPAIAPGARTAFEELSAKAKVLVEAAAAKGEKLSLEQAIDELSRTEAALVQKYNEEREAQIAPKK